MSSENNIQVKEGHYKRMKYNTLSRFISYFYQIESVSNLADIKTVLEIGSGSKLVSRELENIGYQITTCDFDSSVNPDVVADVRKLQFEPNSFDCIMACQVLEHIPFYDFEKVVEDLSRITKKYAIVSLPSRSTGVELLLKVPFIQTIFKKKFFDLSLQFPVKFPGFKESDQHYWEIDFWTTKASKVEKVFKKYFIIKKTFRPPLNKYHRFYILEKN